MKTKLLLLSLITLSFASCKKNETVEPMTYKLPALQGTTWRSTDYYTNWLISWREYDYIHFINQSTLQVYVADLDTNKFMSTKKTYTYKINSTPGKHDTFTINFAGGQTGTGTATENSKVISYENISLQKVE